MKIYFSLFPFLVLLLSAGQTSGQSASVSGLVADSADQLPLRGAHVKLATPQDSTVQETILNDKGNFLFRNIPGGDYHLTIQFLGYATHSSQLTVKEGQEYQAGTILMGVNATELGLIEVLGKPVPVQIKGDTTEFNAAAYTTPPYSDAEELIKKLPGVEVGADGSVKAQGEEIRKVLVDGKEFFGNDPQIAMKNLPADIIDKIQIIDDQSEQAKFTGFDDGNRIKTMNIVTRPDKRVGQFGRMNASLGNQDRYSAGGNYNYRNGGNRYTVIGMTNNVNQQNFANQDLLGVMGGGGGRGRRNNDFYIGSRNGNTVTNALGVDFNGEWLEDTDISGSYFYNSASNNLDQFTNREYILGKNTNQLNQRESGSESRNFNHRVNLQVEYEIDSMNSISLRPNLSFQDHNSHRTSYSETMLSTGEALNNSRSNNFSDNSGYRFDGGMTFRHRFQKRGRTISMNIDASSNTNRSLSNNNSLNLFYKNGVENRLDTIDQLGNSESGGWGFTSRISYTEPLGEYSRLRTNYSLRNTESSSEREIYDYLVATGQYELLNTDLSNEFLNDYMYHRAGLAYQYSKEKFSVDFGMEYQHAHIENRQVFPEVFDAGRSFSSILPEASLSYEFAERQRLRLSYRTDTDAPSISQLQNVIDNSNPLNIRSGNPDLKQAFAHNFSLRYNSFDRETEQHFFASFSADFSNNRIVNSTFIASGDTTIDGHIVLGKGARFSRPENINGFYALRSHASYGKPIEALKLNVNLNTGLSHTHDVGFLNRESTWSNSYGINQGVSLHSNISENINFGAATNINFNITRNDRQAELDRNYFSQNVSVYGTYIFWKGLRVSTNFNYNYNKGYADGYDERFLLWNASVGKSFLKKENAEIRLSAYDLLNNNTNISRNVTERYIEDSRSNTLQQYFLLSINYHLRSFGSGGEGFRRGGPGGRGGRRSF
ncbi:TonB-dependent receptor [Anseongella ginsenosidimutans]|uniref:TonB-dependent receptor n=1 Tax=Anseongella ginsenosidimutans TaxID=496056 RepID=UPI0010488407|nr:TonB-dependent receptor [Anseongella ginsenosidimutans]